MLVQADEDLRWQGPARASTSDQIMASIDIERMRAGDRKMTALHHGAPQSCIDELFTYNDIYIIYRHLPNPENILYHSENRSGHFRLFFSDFSPALAQYTVCSALQKKLQPPSIFIIQKLQSTDRRDTTCAFFSLNCLAVFSFKRLYRLRFAAY